MKNKEMNAFSQKFEVYFMLETLLRYEKAAVSTLFHSHILYIRSIYYILEKIRLERRDFRHRQLKQECL